MLIKLPNGTWMDPSRVTVIQHLPRPTPTVEIHLVDDVAQFLFATYDEAEQFVESTAEIVNKATLSVWRSVDLSAKPAL